MKILQSTSFNSLAKYSQPVMYQRTQYEQDSFNGLYPAKSPNFRANNQNIYKKILESPSLSQKFMGLVSAAAAALIGAAQLGGDDVDSKETNQDFLKLFSSALKNSLSQGELEKKLSDYEEENKSLKLQLEELKAQKKSVKQTEVIDGMFLFPKKRGKLSSVQLELKNATNGIVLTNDISEKLNKICVDALQKGVIPDEDIINFAKNLLQYDEKEQVINEFYSALYKSQDNKETDVVDKKEFVTSFEQPECLKKARNFLHALNDKNGFTYTVPVVCSSDVYSALSALMQKFQQQMFYGYKRAGVQGNKPRWKYNKPVPECITKNDIEFEINRINRCYPQTKYTRIIKEDFDEIAGIINSDSRFHRLFTVHSALRFLERYVNFDSEIPPEKQVSVILNKVESLILTSLKSGVNVGTYSDSGFYAPKIVIPCEMFCDDKEAQSIFGSHDLWITFAESQSSHIYIPNYEKKALISTIYSK